MGIKGNVLQKREMQYINYILIMTGNQGITWKYMRKFPVLWWDPKKTIIKTWGEVSKTTEVRRKKNRGFKKIHEKIYFLKIIQ